jgi:Rps23 Pro-64 3,4-dihydroxylase Tpa1-like proline 4-hydroxylase
MDMYKKIFENLNVNGYHIGNFTEFFNELTEIKEEEFFKWSEFFKSTAIEKDKHYCYRHNFIAQNNPENYVNLPNYSGPIPTNEEKLQEIPYIRAQNRKDFVKRAISGGANIRTTQQWARLKLENFIYDEAKQEEVRNMNKFFENVIRQHTSLIYPELMKKKNTFRLATGYSVYDNGDFSEVHFDGINPGRACVLIMYFADPTTYQEGDGGELLIGHDIKTNNQQILEFNRSAEKCIPVYGNYAIMDFTKFNVGHSIEMVKNNFRRFALQSFVGP